MTTAVWWIRRDLRLADNPALATALASANEVVPLFVLDRRLLDSKSSTSIRTAFLFEGLRRLDRDLRSRGSRLVVRRGDPLRCLAEVVAETGAGAVIAEEDFSPYATQRDAAVVEALPLQLAHGVTVAPPGSIVKADGEPFVVFTPFSRAWRARPVPSGSDVLPAPKAIRTSSDVRSVEIPDHPRLPTGARFEPGEDAALRRLRSFMGVAGLSGSQNADLEAESPGSKSLPTGQDSDASVFSYAELRDRLDLDSTSGLSPYLRFGMLSARQAVVAAMEAGSNESDTDAWQGAETWLNELIWREFYVHILAHFPHTATTSFREGLRGIAWVDDREDAAAWQEGQTGYPVVDAAMRQLVATGWIHNRARMIVASFLVKDLLVDWRLGARYFMRQLVDGDPAANVGGWQWVSGTGTDAAPYFRVFNPVLQGRKFDPRGAFVKEWVPELSGVPEARVHAPWEMSVDEQLASGCRVGRDYPAPIVDHGRARLRALAAYQQAREKS